MLYLKLLIDRILGSIMRRASLHWHEWTWRDPGAALRNELQRRATLAAADFVTTRMPDALYCGGKLDLLTYALRMAPPGLAVEFGVFKGTTITHLARKAPDRPNLVLTPTIISPDISEFHAQGFARPTRRGSGGWCRGDGHTAAAASLILG